MQSDQLPQSVDIFPKQCYLKRCELLSETLHRGYAAGKQSRGLHCPGSNRSARADMADRPNRETLLRIGHDGPVRYPLHYSRPVISKGAAQTEIPVSLPFCEPAAAGAIRQVHRTPRTWVLRADCARTRDRVSHDAEAKSLAMRPVEDFRQLEGDAPEEVARSRPATGSV